MLKLKVLIWIYHLDCDWNYEIKRMRLFVRVDWGSQLLLLPVHTARSQQTWWWHHGAFVWRCYGQETTWMELQGRTILQLKENGWIYSCWSSVEIGFQQRNKIIHYVLLFHLKHCPLTMTWLELRVLTNYPVKSLSSNHYFLILQILSSFFLLSHVLPRGWRFLFLVLQTS